MKSSERPTLQETVASLRAHGIVPTRPRVRLASLLFACRQHVTASGLYRQVQAHGGSMSRSTVYNTLDLFVSKGLLQELSLGDRKRIYDTNLKLHHHLYHVDSGRIEDLDASSVKVDVPDQVLGRSRLIGVDCHVARFRLSLLPSACGAGAHP